MVGRTAAQGPNGKLTILAFETAFLAPLRTEGISWAGKHQNRIIRIASLPGVSRITMPFLNHNFAASSTVLIWFPPFLGLI